MRKEPDRRIAKPLSRKGGINPHEEAGQNDAPARNADGRRSDAKVTLQSYPCSEPPMSLLESPRIKRFTVIPNVHCDSIIECGVFAARHVARVAPSKSCWLLFSFHRFFGGVLRAARRTICVRQPPVKPLACTMTQRQHD